MSNFKNNLDMRIIFFFLLIFVYLYSFAKTVTEKIGDNVPCTNGFTATVTSREIVNDSAFVLLSITAEEAGICHVYVDMPISNVRSISSNKGVKRSINSMEGQNSWTEVTCGNGVWLSNSSAIIKVGTKLPFVPSFSNVKITKGGRLQNEQNVRNLSIPSNNGSVQSLSSSSSFPIALQYELNQTLYGTFHQEMYLNAGRILNISANTYGDNTMDIVLVNSANPQQYNWVVRSDSEGFVQSQFNIPVSGYYKLLAKTVGNNTQDYATVCIDNTYYDDVLISNHYVSCNISSSGTYFFWALSSGASSLVYLEDANGNIIDYNDNSSVYHENDASFTQCVRKILSPGIYRAHYNSLHYSGSSVADVYARAKKASLTITDTKFVAVAPNLSRTSTLVSAPEGPYNCYAWSVGLWQGWEFPDWMVEFTPGLTELGAYIDYYDMHGYDFCPWNNTDQAVIALWEGRGDFNNPENTLMVTHASVRTHNNGIPHGYSWESKMGGAERLYHYRDGVKGGLYGEVICYFKQQPNTQTMSFYEKMATGAVEELVVMPDSRCVQLIQDKVQKVDLDVVNDYKFLRDVWMKSCNSSLYSSLRGLSLEKGYSELAEFCKMHKQETLYLIANDVYEGKDFMFALLKEVIVNDESIRLIAQDVNKSKLVKASDGTNIVKRTSSLMKQFLNACLLKEISQYSSKAENRENFICEKSNKDVRFEVRLNGANLSVEGNLEAASVVSCVVYDLYGNILGICCRDRLVEAGQYNLATNISNVTDMLVCLTIDGVTNVKKIVVK